MATYTLPKNRCKYRVYLSATFQSLDCYKGIIDCITRAGLLYYSADESTARRSDFNKTLEQEINYADMFILLLNTNLDAMKHKGDLTVELEYKSAKLTGKKILVYLTQENIIDTVDKSAIDFITKIKENETCISIGNEDNLPTILVTDIFKVVLTKSNLSSWVRLDINSTKLDSIARKKITIDRNLAQAGGIIQMHESKLNNEERDQIIGPLIDIGLRPNISGQAYQFALTQTPVAEIGHNDLKYQYFIDRFVPYQCGAVYDKLLNLTWLLVKNQSFNWDNACNWKENLNLENQDRISCLQTGKELQKEHKWRTPNH